MKNMDLENLGAVPFCGLLHCNGRSAYVPSKGVGLLSPGPEQCRVCAWQPG